MEQQKLELIDIYDIVYQPWWLTTPAKIGAGITVLVLLSLLAYWIYKKTRKPVVLSYGQQALQDITLLEETDFADGQLFYLRLTEIMKQYLQHHYQLQLVDKTDTELLSCLQTSPVIPEHVYLTMKDLFDGVIFIKFAHQQAAHERMEEAVKKSRALIMHLQSEKGIGKTDPLV